MRICLATSELQTECKKLTNAMTNGIKLEILFLLLVVGLFSCNEGTADKSIQPSDEIASSTLNLSGKVLLYAPELDTNTCEVFGQCDCCSGHYLFLNDKDFLLIDNCEADVFYAKGVYEIDNGNILLHYDGSGVNQEYNWEKETDTTGTDTTEFFLKQSKVDPSTSKLTRFDCKKNIRFNTDSKEIPFAAFDTNTKMTEIINQLKADGIWDKLEMK